MNPARVLVTGLGVVSSIGLGRRAFFEALAEEITEGRDLFRGRVTPELFRRNYYDRAIVDRVVKPMGSLKTPIW